MASRLSVPLNKLQSIKQILPVLEASGRMPLKNAGGNGGVCFEMKEPVYFGQMYNGALAVSQTVALKN